MSDDPFANALILTGPTASGKSALALQLAELHNAEIVSMDSMTLYRGMDIGTAKPNFEDRERIPHHLIDCLEPWESASVAWWLQQAAQAVRDIESRGKRALIVGGTPLYLKALFTGLFASPPADTALRTRLEAEAESLGRQALHQRLQQVDPATAARLHPNDVRRVVRALEVYELTGQPISHWQTQWHDDGPSEPPTLACNPTVPRCLVVDLPREELYARINTRVFSMIAAGWLDEVRRLMELPRPMSREAAQALGYAELLAHLRGQISLADAVERIQTRSRQFAKRQLTWFRHLPYGRKCEGKLTTAIWHPKIWSSSVSSTDAPHV